MHGKIIKRGLEMNMRIALLALMVVAMLATNWTDVFADGPEDEQLRGYFYAPLSGNETGGIEREQEAYSGEAMLGCDYETKGDNPHRSGTGFAVSAHGWWEDNSPGQCPEFADVDIILQANKCYYESDEPTNNCYWDSLNRNKKRIKAGTGGSGRRVPARYDCASSKTVGYRSVIDVDLVGVPDGIGKLYITREIDCYPVGR